jgi:hypothetical protein
MIVFGQQTRRVRPAEVMSRLCFMPARDALIEFGEVESAAADLLSPECDAPNHLIDRMRAISIALAHRLLGEAREWEPVSLPSELIVSTAEGYAWYGLAPEQYAEAAADFTKEKHPGRALVIGIRSIGASLSAVVSAVLEHYGCRTHSCTVRPRGHPFDRRLHLSPEMGERWQAAAYDYALVVDEGPGLSGSSFFSVARALTDLGWRSERIVFFPSHRTDGASLIAAEARAGWTRQPQYTAVPAHLADARDLSAGKWRELFYAGEGTAPAVQPQHERRKFLRGGHLLKFAGFGPYSDGKLDRARALWAAGFAPRPVTLEDGYLITEFLPGRPLADGARPAGLLDRIADYLAFRANAFPSGAPVPFERDLEMIRINVGEALGEEWLRCLETLEQWRVNIEDAATVEIDGRMLPFEWLETAQGLVKTDAIDHHADHFFPGCQDIAWDLAGSIVEFALDDSARNELIDRYIAATHDEGVRMRLKFYLIAYTSFRVGYSHMSAAALGAVPDGQKFRHLQQRYEGILRAQISSLESHAHGR